MGSGRPLPGCAAFRWADGFNAWGLWYEMDSHTEETGDVHHFFIVHNGAIVEESVAVFNHGYDSGFDPTVFQADQDDDPIWRNEPYWQKARTAYWYRKFYQETATGQLMALRPDEPQLFYFPERRGRSMRAMEFTLLGIRRTLEWLLITVPALLAISLFQRVWRWGDWPWMKMMPRSQARAGG